MHKKWSQRMSLAGLLAVSALASPEETVKIGLIEPLTGSVAYNGLASVNGAKLAVAQRNAAGGVLGRQVELVIETNGPQHIALVEGELGRAGFECRRDEP